MVDGGSSPDVASFFDAEAARYDAVYDDAGPAGDPLRARLAATLRLVGDGPGDVLDAGMGAGRLCEALANRGWTVTGVDASAEMVALARRRLPDARLVRARVEQLPFPDASFDAVVATGVVEYAAEPAALIFELARVLRPGAVAVVSVPNVQAIVVRLHRSMRSLRRALRLTAHPPPPHRRRPPAEQQLAGMLASAGLAVEAVHGTAFLPSLGPLRVVAPGLVLRLAARLERTAQPLRRVLAAQLLLAARKPSPRRSDSVAVCRRSGGTPG